MDYRQPLFRLKPAAGPTTYYLRLQTSLVTRPVLTLWPPLAFTEATMAEARIWGLYFGVYALIALLHAFFWMWSQERIHYLFTLYVALNLLAALLAGGVVVSSIDLYAGNHPGHTAPTGLRLAAGYRESTGDIDAAVPGSPGASR